MRHRIVVLLMAGAFVFAAANTALAASVSHVSLGYNASTSHFNGRVRSPNAECVAHRTVKVFRRTSSGPKLQGMTSTGAMGGWSIDVMHPHGMYFAVAVRQTIMSSTCERAVSRVVDVM